jgi:hypothetical protein
MAVDGKYNSEMNSPMGQSKGTLELKSSGNAITGTHSTSRGVQELKGTINGDAISWKIEAQSPMGVMTLEFNGKVAGNEITGVVKLGQFGEAPFKAVKA